jgi:ACS family glucarate transporter-like MFS transporter
MSDRPTFARWRVFLLIASSGFIAYVIRGSISTATPAMMADLGLSEIEFGWVASAFLLSYAIFQFPGGVFGDKIGPRKALAIIAALWAIGHILTALAPGPAAASGGFIIGFLIVVRFLNGVVHAPVFPVINVSISRWFPVGGCALPIGLSSTGLTLGLAATAPAVTWLTINYDWRTSLLIVAPLGFLLSLAWWWYVRDDPADHRGVNAAELELITHGESIRELGPMNPPGWVRILKDRNIVLLTLSYAFSNFLFYSVFSWFPYYLIEIREINATTTGFVTASQWIAAAAGAALGGWLCDWLCKRIDLRWGNRWPIIIGQSGCALFLFIGAYHSSPMIAAAFLGLCFFFQQITEGAYWSSSISIGRRLAGAAGGVINTGANAMGALNALMVPWFASVFGWPFAVASAGIFSVLALVLMLFVRPDEPVALDQV